MPSRKTTRAARANAARMPSIPRELLDQIEQQGPMTAETIQQASMASKKALIERAMSGELSHHLGYGLVRTSKNPFIRSPAADQARLVGMKARGGR